MTYQCAVIGLGAIGSEYDLDPKREIVSSHAGAYTSLENTQLVAICEVDEAKRAQAKERWGVEHAYASAEEMFSQHQFDIVSVCTPTSTHKDVVLLAASHKPKVIICEKPIASRVDEAQEMIRVCKENGVVLLVNHQRRFDPAMQELKSSISRGEFGVIQQVSAYYCKGLMNYGSHLIDLLHFLFGRVEVMMSLPSQAPSQLPADSNYDGLLKLNGKVTCSLQAVDVAEYALFALDIYGTTKRVRLSHYMNQQEYSVVKESAQYSGFKELYPDQVKKNDTISLITQTIRHAVACIEGNAVAISSGEDALQALEVLTAIKHSAEVKL